MGQKAGQGCSPSQRLSEIVSASRDAALNFERETGRKDYKRVEDMFMKKEEDAS
jgi:hypothetical protein